MGFAKLHRLDNGSLIYINPAQVVAFEAYQEGTLITCAVASGSDYYEPVVSESLDEVASALEAVSGGVEEAMERVCDRLYDVEEAIDRARVSLARP